MKTTKLIAPAFLLILVIFFSSCTKSPYPGYKKTKDGLFYKVVRNNSDKALPKEGDILVMDLKYMLQHNDSVIFDSKLAGSEVVLPVQKPLFKGDVNEGMFMITEGDSASFIVKADSFMVYNVKLQKMPPFIKPETMLRFELKVKSHKTKDEYMAEMKIKQQEREAQNAELKTKEKEELAKYISDNKITVKPTESGLYFISIKKGKGTKVETGDKVSAHYKGTFLNGEVFDSSEGAKEPYSFVVGAQQVIPGWDEAVLMMRKGDKAKIILPSSLGYGETQPGYKIPPFSSLVFELEIVDVQKTEKK